MNCQALLIHAPVLSIRLIGGNRFSNWDALRDERCFNQCVYYSVCDKIY